MVGVGRNVDRAAVVINRTAGTAARQIAGHTAFEVDRAGFVINRTAVAVCRVVAHITDHADCACFVINRATPVVGCVAGDVAGNRAESAFVINRATIEAVIFVCAVARDIAGNVAESCAGGVINCAAFAGRGRVTRDVADNVADRAFVINRAARCAGFVVRDIAGNIADDSGRALVINRAARCACRVAGKRNRFAANRVNNTGHLTESAGVINRTAVAGCGCGCGCVIFKCAADCIRRAENITECAGVINRTAVLCRVAGKAADDGIRLVTTSLKCYTGVINRTAGIACRVIRKIRYCTAVVIIC